MAKMSEPRDDETLNESEPSMRAAGRVPTAALFLVLDCGRPAAGGSRHLLSNLDEVIFRRASTPSSERTVTDDQRRLTIGVADPRASSRHARISRKGDRFVLEDCGSTNGTRVGGARVEARVVLHDEDLIEIARTFYLFRDAVPVGAGDAADVASEEARHAIPSMATLLPSVSADLDALARIARSPLALLLLGETGTGKELLARGVHALSGRTGPFVPVNCAALSPSLVESQLFGHTKGAFSGAQRDEDGFVRAASSGTLFLDEVGDLPLAAQGTLLRVLQEREVVPVGSSRAVAVDVRFVAATHADLEALVERGSFRRDLYARLAGFVHTLPPLRARREDFGVVLASVLERAGATDLAFTVDAATALLRHDWPMNIRELAQAVAASAVLSSEGPVGVDHLPAATRAPAIRAPESAHRETLEEDEDDLRRALVTALARHAGNVSEVAREMGKARMQVQRWMKRWGLERTSFKP